jgi:hypothetical protein
LRLIVEARLATEAFTRGDREQVAVGFLSAQQVALVRTVLDLATDALPVLLKRVVALDDRLQLEALGGVANLLAAQQVDAPIDVLARDCRLDLFEAEKVLLVERAQTLEPGLQLLQRHVELGLIQRFLSARQGLDAQVVEADRRQPVVEPEMVVASSREG